MRPKRLQKLMDELGMNNSGLAVFLGVSTRTIRRFMTEDAEVPLALQYLLELMAAKKIKPNQVRQIAGLEPFEPGRLNRQPGFPWLQQQVDCR